ncbi:hypothetical protein FQR65_LT04552 [Abscondita terminalis]|nr:hypothetical protein FQR65_LT04552 [Abscondita terminalis]
MYRYSVILSYIVLFLICCYCFIEYYKKINFSFGFVYITLSIISSYSALGALRWSFPCNWKLEEMHVLTYFLIPSVAVPCTVLESWWRHGVLENAGVWIHLIVGLILSAFKMKRFKIFGMDAVNFCVFVNLLCLLIVTLLYEDFNIAILLLLFIMAQYAAYSKPPEHLYNYCLAGFTYAVCKSI